MQVRCINCDRRFKGFAPDQANGCAAELRGHLVAGAPGSRVLPEGIAYFPSGAIHGMDDGPICDDCIRDLANDGSLNSRHFRW